VWIAFCYGWLPVAVGYYLQTGRLAPLVHMLALPIGLTIFNVILLNEFPDYPADAAAGKRNLTVRLGRQRAAVLYTLTAVAGWAGVAVSYIWQAVPRHGLWLHLPVLALSLTVVLAVARGRWQKRAVLERLCAGNLMVNLGTTAAYLAAFVLWR
jgi:1,4-dihydroxy-2-naphthoate octaprenyltransferase